LDLSSGVAIHAPGLAGGAPVLSRFEQTLFIAFGHEMTNNASRAKSLGTLDETNRALWFTIGSAINGFTSIWNNAPASSN
jgi:hypothetical protein